MIALLLGLGLAAAEGGDPWYIGLPVDSVQLQAPEGGLPEENLEPLLRSKQGEILDLGAVRQDIALLYRTGAFAKVEAIATPYTVEDEGGAHTSVLLTYLVTSPPRLASVEVNGVRGAAARVVKAALGLEAGSPFYGAEDTAAVRARLLLALQENGWTEATVQVDTATNELDEPTLSITVEAGQAARYGEIEILADVLEEDDRCGIGDRAAAREGDPCDLTTRTLRRWLRGAGVKEGERITAQSREEAIRAVGDALIARGWLNARVTTLIPPTGDAEGRRSFTLRVEGRDRLVIDAHGPPEAGRVRLPPAEQMTQTLGLFAGDRLTEGSLAEADRRLRSWYDRLGYPAARSQIRPHHVGNRVYLDVEVDPGPRQYLDDVTVDGALAWTPRYLAQAEREADPETLGNGLFSNDGLSRADRALDELYRGQGYLAAEVHSVVVPVDRPRRRLRHRPWTVSQPVEIRTTVIEGEQTFQRSLEVTGGVGLEQAILQGKGAPAVGEPFQPARLDALAQSIASAYRSQGYLNVNVNVKNSLRGGAVDTLIAIDPGNPLLLRSVIIQGNQRTRRKVIAREVALTVGEPITPEALLETRSHLYGLDLFRLVSPELVGDDDRSRDLLLNVEEKPNIAIESGGGVSTDQGIQLKTRLTHRNLGGLAHTVNLLGQVGFGWSGDGWLLDTATPTYRAAVRYQAPLVFFGLGTHIVVDGLLGELTQEPTFRISRSGASVGIRASQGRSWDLFVDYRVQVRRLVDVDPGALVYGDPWLDALSLDPGESATEITLPSERRVVSGPEAIFVLDRRDDRFNPHKGLFMSGLFEISDGLVSLPWTMRGDLRVEQFIPAGPLVIDLIGRTGAGAAGGPGEVLPIDERFNLGGATTLRGFNLGTAGPANYIARPTIDHPGQTAPAVEGLALRDQPAHWVPTGGELLLTGTVEVRVPFSALGAASLDSAALALFTDVGHLGFLDPSVTTDSVVLGVEPLVRVGMGVGLRISTPIGPASVDLGVNPWRLPGRDEPLFTPHLSLGEL